VLVNVYPLVYTFVLSFQEYKLSSATGRWIGFANYTKILSDHEVWNSIWISIVFTGASVGISFVIGLALALLLNRRMRGRHVVRSVFIIPWAVPAFVAALTWSWMFNDQFGIISGLTRALGGKPVVWLGKDYALASLITVMVWKSFPFQVVVLLAGLQAINQELYEAASVDGAGTVAKFWHITIALLKPIAMVAILLASINAFNYFTIPWILTRGGPAGATSVLPIATYNIGFIAGDYGYAAAGAVLMFWFILLMSVLYVYQYIQEVRSLE
jgi:ABC-type sugar transport system permease subunit